MMSQKKKNAITRVCDRQLFIDEDVAFVLALETKLQADTDSEELIEVDTASDGIYRVWKGMKVIGLIKRCPRTQFWIAEPAGLYNPRRYPSSELAVSAVIRAWEGA